MPDETSNVCWKKIRRNIGTETTIDVRCERTPLPQSPSCLVATVVDRICKPPSSNRSTNYSSNREIIKEVSPEDSVLLLRPTPENGFVSSFSLSLSLSPSNTASSFHDPESGRETTNETLPRQKVLEIRCGTIAPPHSSISLPPRQLGRERWRVAGVVTVLPR